MTWLRMGWVALRVAWPHVLTPWRSPLLRSRVETYGVRDERGRLLHADQITASRFIRFTVAHRQALTRFLRWAGRL